MQIEDILKVWPSTLPLHSSGKTVNDKPRKRQMWDIGWHRGIPIFRIFTFSNVSGKMRPPDIFISSGATKSHFMKVFKKLRFHEAFQEIWWLWARLETRLETWVSHGKHDPFLVMREMTAFLSVRSVLIQMSACVGKSYFVEDLNCDIRLLTSFVWHLDSTDRWWPQSLSWSTTS